MFWRDRSYFVPVAASGIVALLSLIYFSAVAAAVPPAVMAEYIREISLAALVQVLCIPQSWVTVFRHERLNIGTLNFAAIAGVELLGAAVGFAAVMIMAALMQSPLVPYAFLAFAMAGSTSTNGFYRRYGHWWRLLASTVMASLLRVVLWFGFCQKRPDISTEELILMMHLMPEASRYVFFQARASLGAIRHCRWQRLRFWIRKVRHNWQYDVLSSVSEVADKFFVSTFLAPSLAVSYFMARKLSASGVMVSDPWFALRYRRLPKGNAGAMEAEARRFHWQIVAASLCIALVGILLAPWIMHLIRGLPLVRSLSWITTSVIALVFVDLVNVGNKWTRYRAMALHESGRIMLSRTVTSLVFFAMLATVSNLNARLIMVFALYTLLDVGSSLLVFRRCPPTQGA